MKHPIAIAFVLWLFLFNGCGFARRDKITEYLYPDTGVTQTITESTTVWTLFKEIEWGQYQSTNNKIKVIGPSGYIESE